MQRMFLFCKALPIPNFLTASVRCASMQGIALRFLRVLAPRIMRGRARSEAGW